MFIKKEKTYLAISAWQMAGPVKNRQNNVAQTRQRYTRARTTAVRRAIAAAQVEEVQAAAAAGHAALGVCAVLVDVEGVQEVGVTALE